tara:strand:+ start:19 stop:993 length:975 start_codon:yes stop_codon:yes gene_type:complete
MNSQQQPHQTEEIDLGYFFKQISNFFKGIVKLGFMILTFFKKQIIWIALLIIAGAVLGYFMEKNSSPMYQNKVVLIPNFESADYLYNKVAEINFKIKQKDSAFIKQFTGENWRRLLTIKIEPVPDIYNFITESRERIDVFRIMFENQELSEFVEDVITSRQYKYHKLNFFIGGDDGSDVVIKKIIAFLNDNEHYKKYQEVGQQNTALRINEANKMIKQIDDILTAFALIPESGSNNRPLKNENSAMYDIAEYKQVLLLDKLKLEMKQKDETEIIKMVSAEYNIIDNGFFSFSKKIKYPIYLVLLFSLVFFIPYSLKSLRDFSRT